VIKIYWALIILYKRFYSSLLPQFSERLLESLRTAANLLKRILVENFIVRLLSRWRLEWEIDRLLSSSSALPHRHTQPMDTKNKSISEISEKNERRAMR
jgi:hypothetical protein